MKKKFLTLFVMLISVICCVFGFAACGDNESTGNQETEGLEYELKDDYYMVAGIGTAKGSKIVIPSTYNGKPVKEIGYKAFLSNKKITDIKIPDSVTYIGPDAFKGCDKLIQTENDIQYVDKWVIDCNSSEVEITLRSNTVGIANSAFTNCSFKSIVIPDSVNFICISAFWNCSLLEDIIMGDNVTSIGQSAFKNCSSLKIITIPNGVTNIFAETFEDCSSLKSITIPEGVTSIGSYAFCRCSSLTSITIPSSVASIGQSAFGVCSSLTEINFKGTKTQWNAIKINSAWGGTGNITVHCTDGDIKIG